jgi:serine/arginine repetitive matrix protein 2
LHGKHASASHKPASESPWTKSASATGSGLSGTTSRSGFKEAPISALDDVMLRIKGVLTDMHAEGEKPAALSTSFPPSNGVASDSIPAPAPVADAPSKAAQGVALRWIGTKTANWRDGMNKKVLGQTPVETQPTEPFAISRLERPDTPPPVWKAYTVRLNKSTVVRPPLSKKQASLAKLPPMPVRWDILTWDPPVERMSTKTLSRDDMLFPKTYLRGILSARVLLPSSGSTPEVQARLNESSTQRLRLSATVDVRTSRSPNMSSRPVPKSPAFMDAQWRKPQPATSPINNALELQDTTPASAVSSEGNQLETTSRSPPPHHQPVGDKTNVNVNSVTPSSSSKAPLRSSQNTDVTFHRSLHEKRPSNPPTVSFTVSSELDDPSMTEIKLEDKVVPDNCPILEVNGSAPLKVETRDSVVDTRFNESASGDKFEQTISGGKVSHFVFKPTVNCE